MQVLAALLSIWLPTNAPGQAVDDGSGTQAPATHLTRIELLAGAAIAMPWKALGGWSSLASRMGLLNEVSTMWP